MKRVLLLILLLVVAAAVFVAVPAYFLRNARWLGGDGSTSSGRGGDQPIVANRQVARAGFPAAAVVNLDSLDHVIGLNTSVTGRQQRCQKP